MGLSYKEQETVITFDRADRYKMNVYTADASLINRLDKYPESYKLLREFKSEGNVVAKYYEADRRLLTLRSKRATNNMTEEQKQAARERLKKIREKKKIDDNKNE